MATVLDVNKIDRYPTDGLAGPEKNSLAYRVHEIEKHVHSIGQCFGNSSGNMVKDYPAVFQLTSGNGAWGTDTQIYDGTTIESGSSSKYFDLHEMFVVAVGTANRLTLMNWQTIARSAAITATQQNAGDTITPTVAANVPANGTRIMFAAAGLPAAYSAFIVYYVVGAAATTFQVSLTVGGAAVVIAGDGTASFYTCTMSELTSNWISMAGTSTDSWPIIMQCPRITCDTRISLRGWSVGGTNTVDHVYALHSYQG